MPEYKILRDINLKKNNKYHTIKIGVSKVNSHGNLVDTEILIGWIKDDTYKESIKSKFEPVYSGSGNSGIENLNKLLSVLGIGSLKTKGMYRQTWVDQEPTVFNMNVFFQAETDAFYDVVRPLRILQKLQVPHETNIKNLGILNNFLVPPGAAFIKSEALQFRRQGMFQLKFIQIGKFIKLKNIVITSIDTDWNILNIESRGIPLQATVTMEFQSIDLWTDVTIDNLTNVKNTGDAVFEDIKGDTMPVLDLTNFKTTIDSLFGSKQ